MVCFGKIITAINIIPENQKIKPQNKKSGDISPLFSVDRTGLQIVLELNADDFRVKVVLDIDIAGGTLL